LTVALRSGVLSTAVRTMLLSSLLTVKYVSCFVIAIDVFFVVALTLVFIMASISSLEFLKIETIFVICPLMHNGTEFIVY